MAISKSTPYVRYKKDFTSSLHLGTIHIESEYLDRTQKTTIESIHGMTWHNKVVNENKELNLLSDTQLELTDLEKQYWNTGEKCVSVDEIHTLEEVEPNEDGTYTYTVNSMEGEYIEIYDGINNITSTSDGLDGQFEIVYDTTEEDINGNIALDAVAPQYEITDSGVGAITGAKSTGLTLVNNITEPSKEEVSAIQEYEGQCFTIENTVQGNIKSAILKGQTLVNLITTLGKTILEQYQDVVTLTQVKPSTKYLLKIKNNTSEAKSFYSSEITEWTQIDIEANQTITKTLTTKSILSRNTLLQNLKTHTTEHDLSIIFIEYQDGMENWDIPYFYGMQSVKMPVLKTTGKNLFNKNNVIVDGYIISNGNLVYEKGDNRNASDFIEVEPNCTYRITGIKNSGINGARTHQYAGMYDKNKKFISATHLYCVSDSATFTTTENAKYIRVSVRNDDINRLQIEKGTTATTYEPHKSNILTVNEDVELRGIGDVKDELNVVTGEFTQRIGEVVLDGSDDEKWWYAGHSDTIIRCNVAINIKWQTQILCADMPVDTPNLGVSPFRFEGVANHFENYIYLYLKTEKIENYSDDSTNEDKLAMVRDWLSKNPITIQYQLATESVKTVDLTVQNQGGNTIPHMQTQQGITHVSTSSDGLTPVVEMSCSYDTIIKPNTTYTIKLDRPIVSDTMYLQVDLGGTMMMLDADVNAFTIKTPSTLSHSQLRLSGTGNTVKEIIVLEGNRVNDKIEYFEGMKNVENPILVVSNCPYVFGEGGRK